ncbi:glycosyltransferase family 4 protein [Cellulosimicrobium sp. Marseille-Q8652]
MEANTEVWLTHTLQEWGTGAGGSERLHQRARGIETAISEILGASAYERRGAVRGPDLVITRDGSAPIAIELKVVNSANFAKNARNRVAELLAASVETRRAFRDPLVLGAILLISGRPNVEDFVRFLSPLFRSLDGVGYDVVVIGYVDAGMRWLPLFGEVESESVSTEHGTLYAKLVDSDAISTIIRSLSPAHQNSGDGPNVHPSNGRRFLFVADEWRSGLGGISTVNRELATALATRGCDVVTMVPIATDEDVRSASDAGVALVTPARIPGLSRHSLLTLRPILPVSSWKPDFIVGHGRILGPFAAAQQQEFFPEARRLHFVHTAAGQLEAAKRTAEDPFRMEKADERRGLERDLAQSASLVVGVGPLLADSISDDLISGGQRPPVLSLVPGLRDGYISRSGDAPVRNSVLIVGRADDFHSKGIDIAAEALLKVRRNWGTKVHPPHLVIRGVPRETEEKVAGRLDTIFEGAVEYDLRPYSNSEEDVVLDLAQAKVVLLPSRHEGFGLAAYEAVASAVPVLISENSGLAMFLRLRQLDTSPTSILPIVTAEGGRPIADVWADAIVELLRKPEDARERAAALRESLARVVSWSDAVDKLLEAVENLG